MKFIKKHKMAIIVIFVTIIICILSYFALKTMFIFGNGSKYGNRLDGIEEVLIINEQVQKLTNEMNEIKDIISIKYDLENYNKQYELNLKEIKNLEDNINQIDYNLKTYEDELYLLSKDKFEINSVIENKNKELMSDKSELEITINNISGTDSMLNKTLSKDEEEIINKYYQEISKKEELMNELTMLQNKKSKLQDELEDKEHENKIENTLYNSKNKELKNLEIEVNRFDVKLDMLLNSLNENYSLTYEKAKSD